MQFVHQVAAVIHDQLGMGIQCFIQIHVVFFVGAGVGGEYGDAVCHQGSRHIVLCGKRITAGNRHVGAAVFQRQRKIGSLGFQMNRDYHVDAFE